MNMNFLIEKSYSRISSLTIDRIFSGIGIVIKRIIANDERSTAVLKPTVPASAKN